MCPVEARMGNFVGPPCEHLHWAYRAHVFGCVFLPVRSHNPLEGDKQLSGSRKSRWENVKATDRAQKKERWMVRTDLVSVG